MEVRTLTDGGQTADEIANAVASFLGSARKSLDLALYDVRLNGDSAEIVKRALTDAKARGVAVRLLYNVDHPGPIPVPPPPQTRPELLEELDLELRAIAGIPDLMHHKYVVRDREAVWTGSLNWTEDAWTRQENVVAVLASPDIAHAYTLDFEELWQTGKVEGSGDVEPRPVPVDGIEVRPWFCPEYGDALAHRMAKKITRARQRVRIASPVISSGPVLWALADVASSKQVDLTGVVDHTQVEEVLEQWRSLAATRWKAPVLKLVLSTASFTGKRSTRWTPGATHDYMHAKVAVIDDVVFLGSFNLSHSGELNAENTLEVKDGALADRLAAYIDEVRARYPAVALTA